MTATLHTWKLQDFLRLVANSLHAAEPSGTNSSCGPNSIRAARLCQLQPRTRRPKPPRFVTAVCGDNRPCKQSGLSGEHPIPRDSPAPTVFPHKGQPREGSPHVGRDHIPAAVRLGFTRMLSRGMSCQVLQLSWKWLDGCPQCSCTKGCRKIGDVSWRLLRNPTVKDLSLYTS